MSNLKQCKIIGFDLDGTLYPASSKIDAVIQAYIHKKIAEHQSISTEEAKKRFDDLYKNGQGLSGRKTLETLRVPDAGEVVQEALERADVASVLSPNPAVLEMLETLRSHGKELSILTGSNKPQLDSKLHALGLPRSLFTHIITDEVAHKSSGAAFELWQSYYPKRNADEFVYIGDRPHSDYEIPTSLGMYAILVHVQDELLNVDCPQLSTVTEVEQLLI